MSIESDGITAKLKPEEFRHFCKIHAIRLILYEGDMGGDADLEKAIGFLRDAIEASEKD